MIQSLLIANRGEIACRIIRTARRLGIRTVAVYSDADAQALHVRSADEAVHIGRSPVRESYLLGDKIIAAAKQTGAQAVHPGYGFLSENAEFAQAVTDAGLIWVGPNPSSITAMGLKDAAKRLMSQAGVPTTPGYLGDDQSPERLKSEADAIGYPVLIKAVAGGGGKGMRKVDSAADFADALPRNYKVVWPGTLGSWAFAAILTNFEPEAPHDDKLAASATFKVSGKPTITTGA